MRFVGSFCAPYGAKTRWRGVSSMSSRAVLPTLDRTFIPRRLRRSHDHLVGCAGVSSTGCTPRDIKFVFRNFRYPASAPPGGVHPENETAKGRTVSCGDPPARGDTPLCP